MDIKEIISSSLENLKNMADSNLVVGEAIRAGDVTIIPVSQISFGYISGGSEFSKQPTKTLGGSSAGVTVKPSAFIVIKPDGDVKLLEVGKSNTVVDSLLTETPELIAKMKGVFSAKTDGSVE